MPVLAIFASFWQGRCHIYIYIYISPSLSPLHLFQTDSCFSAPFCLHLSARLHLTVSSGECSCSSYIECVSSNMLFSNIWKQSTSQKHCMHTWHQTNLWWHVFLHAWGWQQQHGANMPFADNPHQTSNEICPSKETLEVLSRVTINTEQWTHMWNMLLPHGCWHPVLPCHVEISISIWAMFV